MKKTSMLAMALAALAIGGAQASTIYIGGASAFRKTAFDALTTSGWGVKATDQSSLTNNGPTRVVYTNGFGDSISTCWSGSEAGVQSALAGTNSRPLTFIPVNTTGVNITNAAACAGGAYVSTNADAALTDNSSVISRYNGTPTLNELVGGTNVSITYSAPADEKFVGVQSFVWMASSDFPVNLAKSISGNAARNLIQNGKIQLSLLTGDSAHSNSYVWLYGRNPDSGTRLTTFNEVGLSSLATAKQYYTTASTNSKITSIKLTPATNINGLNVVEGDNGESSGGTLAGKVGPMDSTITVITSTNTNTITATPVTNVVAGVVSTNWTSSVTNVPYTITNITGYTVVTNGTTWTNIPATNKVYVSYNQKYTNPAKTAGDAIVKYKIVSKIKGSGYESSLFAASVTNVTVKTAATYTTNGTNVTVKKPATYSTNITPAVFNVSEYYNDALAANWVQVAATTTNPVTEVTTTNYTITNWTSSLVTNGGSTSVSSGNYVVTYCSVADALTASTVNSQYPVLLNYNNDGVAGSMAVSADRDAAKANIASKIKNGSYSFWNVESAVLSPNAQSGAADLFNTIVTTIPAKVSAPNVALPNMNVKRATDGDVITAK